MDCLEDNLRQLDVEVVAPAVGHALGRVSNIARDTVVEASLVIIVDEAIHRGNLCKSAYYQRLIGGHSLLQIITTLVRSKLEDGGGVPG